MSRRILLTLCAASVSAIANPLSAQSQQASITERDFTVEEALAVTGRKVFSARGCIGCHTVGKGELSAPDLGGLFERRTTTWVRKWLRDPPAMLASDDIAKNLLKKYNNYRMPNLKLTEDEITALMHYIAAETMAAKSSVTPTQ